MSIKTGTYSYLTCILLKLQCKPNRRYCADKATKIIKSSLFIFMLLIFVPELTIAQKKPPENSEPKRDSLIVYKKLKKMAYKYKVTSWAYDLVFVDPEPKEYPTQPASKEIKNANPYLKYEGSIIKDIKITIYDPFGHNVNDTNMANINRLQKLGNRAHITTRKFVIINKLLFKVNDTINPLSLSETERILREALFINDARIYITRSKHRDSVIVNVVVQDKWPITVPILVTDIFVNARFRNHNLFGAGQQFEQFGKISKPNTYEFNGYYGIANIDNTYISARLGYATDKDETKVYLAFDRPFFSPLTAWAGGVSFSHSWKKYVYTDTIIGESKRIPLNNFGYDLWAGKSFKFKKLSKDKSFFNQSTNFILGARYYSSAYLSRPSQSIDSSKSYYNAKAALGNIGFAVQKYYKDKYIYRFGANEDVPEGLIVQFIYGALKYEFKKIRYYTGVEIARAKHFKKLGYLSATFSYGIFFNEKVPNDITTNYKLYYFSNLLKNGQWYFREFLTFNYVHGENKLANETINFGDELYGFENRTLSGNTKMTLNSETVAYLPYNLIGFRLAPVINIGIGMIGSKASPLKNSSLYQAYTVGVMIRNENLLSSTFQFAVGAYPFFPDEGKFRLKYNPISSFTLRVRAFSVSKPEFISY